MNAVPPDLVARATALGAGVAAAIGGPTTGVLAHQAREIVAAVPPGDAADDAWHISRHDGRVTIVGPDVLVFGSGGRLEPTSVRVMSGTRIMHVATGDPAIDEGGLTGMIGNVGLGVLGLDSLGLGGGATGASPAGIGDEYRQRMVGEMRVSIVDGDQLIANDVYDATGIGRPVTELAMEEATERIEAVVAGFEQFADQPGETDNATVSAPADGSIAGTPSLGGAGRSGATGGLAAAAGTVTAVAASAAIRRLMRAAKRPDEPAADTDTAPPPADQPTSAPADSVACVFCATALAATDRFCRGCGRTGPEARREVWAATHVVPASGLYAFERPDPSLAPSHTLEAGLPLQVQETLGVWSNVVASNGWTAWVDGRYLDPA